MKYILCTICFSIFILSGCSNKRNKHETKEVEQLLTIDVGDVIDIGEKKVTLINKTNIYQRYTSSSKLTKEEILKLKDYKKRSPSDFIYLHLEGDQSEYAQYNDKISGLFMYSPDRIYVVQKEGEVYKFILFQNEIESKLTNDTLSLLQNDFESIKKIRKNLPNKHSWLSLSDDAVQIRTVGREATNYSNRMDSLGILAKQIISWLSIEQTDIFIQLRKRAKELASYEIYGVHIRVNEKTIVYESDLFVLEEKIHELVGNEYSSIMLNLGFNNAIYRWCDNPEYDIQQRLKPLNDNKIGF